MSHRTTALKKVLSITRDLARAETPCGNCMAVGCAECHRTGIDLTSLRTMRRSVADALDAVATLHHGEMFALAVKLRQSSGIDDKEVST